MRDQELENHDGSLIDSDCPNPVEVLAQEFLDRRQQGERPTIKEYCDRHPELANEIRELFEAIAMVEDLKPASDDPDGTLGGVVAKVGAPLRQVGDYRILREVGRGGMGVVYEAEQESLGRRVALKILPRSAAGDARSLLRFEREAKAAARMHHTNIVPVFDVGEADNLVFYAMQLIQGQGLDLVIEDIKRLRNESIARSLRGSNESQVQRSIAESLVQGSFVCEALDDSVAAPLDETVEQESRLSPSASLPGQSEISVAENNRGIYYRSVAKIGLDTASALSYAHARGIIHRDIKPSNLLLDTAGVVWVTDFGLAKTSDSAMTHTGDLLGTLRYMSPERFKGHCDVRADVYSLGLTLYELLVLQPAFQSSDRIELIEMMVNSELRRPRTIDSQIPRDLETIVLKACDKDPRRRYQSADELAEDLNLFINDEPIHARRVSPSERVMRWSRRNKALSGSLFALAASLVLIAVGATYAAHHFREMRDDSVELARSRENQRLAAQRQSQLAVEAEQEASRRAEQLRLLSNQSDLRLAASLWEGENVTADEIREILDRQAKQNPDLLDFPYHYLNHVLENGSVAYQTGEDGPVHLAFGPEGTFYTLGRSGTLHWWGQDTRAPRRTIHFAEPGVDHAVTAISENGKWVAAANGTTITIHEASSGRTVSQWELGSEGAEVLDFSFYDDSRRMIVASSHGEELFLHAYDVASGRLLESPMPPEFRSGLPTERYFIEAWQRGRAGEVRFSGFDVLHTTDDGRWVLPSVPRFPMFGGNSTNIVFDSTASTGSPTIGRTGKVAVTPYTTGTLMVFLPPEKGSGEIEFVAEIGAYGSVTMLRMSPDESIVAAGTRNGTITLFDLSDPRKPRVLRQLRGHSDPIATIRFSEDGETVISATVNGEARIWELAESNWIKFDREAHWCFARLSPDASTLAIASSDQCEIWNLSPLYLRQSMATTNSYACAFSPDGKMLALVDGDAIGMWELDSGKMIRSISLKEIPIAALGNGIGDLDFSPNGHLLAAGLGGVNAASDQAQGVKAIVWDLRRDEIVFQSPTTDRNVGTVRFSPDGKMLAAVSRDDLMVFNVPANPRDVWKQVASNEILPPCERYFSIGFSADSKRLSAGGRYEDCGLLQFDTRDWRVSGSLSTPDNYEHPFETQGGTLVSVTRNGQLRLWNPDSLRSVASLNVGRRTFNAGISRDGRTLITSHPYGVSILATKPDAWRNSQHAAELLHHQLERASTPVTRSGILRAAMPFPATIAELSRLHPEDVDLKFVRAEAAWNAGRFEESRKLTSESWQSISPLADFVESSSALDASVRSLVREAIGQRSFDMPHDLVARIDGNSREAGFQNAGVLVGDGAKEVVFEGEYDVNSLSQVRIDILPVAGQLMTSNVFAVEEVELFVEGDDGTMEKSGLVSNPFISRQDHLVDGDRGTDWHQRVIDNAASTILLRARNPSDEGNQSGRTEETADRNNVADGIQVDPGETNRHVRLVIHLDEKSASRRLRVFFGRAPIDNLDLEFLVRLEHPNPDLNNTLRFAVASYLAGRHEFAKSIANVLLATETEDPLMRMSLRALKTLVDSDGSGDGMEQVGLNAVIPAWFVGDSLQLASFVATRIGNLDAVETRKLFREFEVLCRDEYLASSGQQGHQPSRAESNRYYRLAFRDSDWAVAAQHYELLTMQDPEAGYVALGEPLVLYGYAYLKSKDPNWLVAYQRCVQRLIDRYGGVESAAQDVVRNSLLLVDSQAPFDARSLDQLRKKLDRGSFTEVQETWCQMAMGLAAVRLGNPADAIPFTEQGAQSSVNTYFGLEDASRAINIAIRALALIEINAFSDAEKDVAEATRLIEKQAAYGVDGFLDGSSFNGRRDFLIADLLLQQARQSLVERKASD